MKHRCFGLLFVLFSIVLLSYGRTSAQSRVNSSGTGGIHVIQGRIYMPDGTSPKDSMSVSLESNNFSTISVYTDGNGAFTFQALSPGNYTVVLNGGEHFEVAREYITIDPGSTGTLRSGSPMIFTVPLYLMPKRGSQSFNNEVLNAKLANVPKDAVDLFNKGREFLGKGKSDEALDSFGRAIVAYPNFGACHIEVGKIYMLQGKLDLAATSFRNAIRIDRKDFDGHVNLGIALMNGRKYDEAEPELVTAAYLNKTAVTPHYYLGLMYIEKRDYDIAQRALETARGLSGADSFPLLHKYLGGIYLAKHMNKQAVDELARYVELVPNAKDAAKIRQTISELKTKS